MQELIPNNVKDFEGSEPIIFNDKCIFQYGKIDHLKENLEKTQLKFTSLDKFNDPYESTFLLHYYTNQIELYQEFSSLRNSGYEFIDELQIVNIRELIKDILKRIRVTCLSENATEALMWSHYANKHEGICYVFDRDKIFSDPKMKSVDVQYSNKLPEINFFEGFTTDELLRKEVESIIRTKSINWSYEKEVRFFIDSNKEFINFEPLALQAIILGFNCASNITEIMDDVDKYNLKFDTEVEIYRSVKSLENFEMQIYKDFPLRSDVPFKVGHYNVNDRKIIP